MSVNSDFSNNYNYKIQPEQEIKTSQEKDKQIDVIAKVLLKTPMSKHLGENYKNVKDRFDKINLLKSTASDTIPAKLSLLIDCQILSRMMEMKLIDEEGANKTILKDQITQIKQLVKSVEESIQIEQTEQEQKIADLVLKENKQKIFHTIQEKFSELKKLHEELRSEENGDRFEEKAQVLLKEIRILTKILEKSKVEGASSRYLDLWEMQSNVEKKLGELRLTFSSNKNVAEEAQKLASTIDQPIVSKPDNVDAKFLSIQTKLLILLSNLNIKYIEHLSTENPKEEKTTDLLKDLEVLSRLVKKMNFSDQQNILKNLEEKKAVLKKLSDTPPIKDSKKEIEDFENTFKNYEKDFKNITSPPSSSKVTTAVKAVLLPKGSMEPTEKVNIPLVTLLNGLTQPEGLDVESKQKLYSRFTEAIRDPAEAESLQKELMGMLNNARFSEHNDKIQHLIIFVDFIKKAKEYGQLNGKVDAIVEYLKEIKTPEASTTIPKKIALTSEEIDMLLHFPYISGNDWCGVRDTLMHLGLTESYSSKDRVLGDLFDKNMRFVLSQYNLSRFLDRSAPARMGDLVFLDKGRAFEPKLEIAEIALPSWGVQFQEFAKENNKIHLAEFMLGKAEDGSVTSFPQDNISLQERLNRRVFRMDFNQLVKDKSKVVEVEKTWRELLGENQFKEDFFSGLLVNLEEDANIWKALFKKYLPEEGEEFDVKSTASAATTQQISEAPSTVGTKNFISDGEKSKGSFNTVNTVSDQEVASNASFVQKFDEGDNNNPQPKKIISPETRLNTILGKVYTQIGSRIEKWSQEDLKNLNDETLPASILAISLLALKADLEEKGIQFDVPDFSNVESLNDLYPALKAFLDKNNALPLLTTQEARLTGSDVNFSNVNQREHVKDKDIPYSLEIRLKTPPYIKESVPIIAPKVTTNLNSPKPVPKMEIHELAQKNGQLNLYQYLYTNKIGDQFPFKNDFLQMIGESFRYYEEQNKDWIPQLKQMENDFKQNTVFQDYVKKTNDPNLNSVEKLLPNLTDISFQKKSLTPISGGMGGAYLFLNDQKEKVFVVKPNPADLLGPTNTKECAAFMIGGTKNETFQKIRPQLPPVVKDSIVDSNFYIRQGIPLGSSAQNEALGFQLALTLGLESITPFTCMAVVESNDFKMPSDVLKDPTEFQKLEPTKRKFLCSIQPFVNNSSSLDSFLEDLTRSLKTRKIPEEMIEIELEQKFSYKNIFNILFLEALTGECDPNTGNYLVINDPQDKEKQILLKIDNALILSELHSDFANGYFSNVDSLPLFATFPNFVNAPIPKEEREEMKKMLAKEAELKKHLKDFKKEGKAIQIFDDRLKMINHLLDTHPYLTLKELFACLGSTEGVLKDSTTGFEIKK